MSSEDEPEIHPDSPHQKMTDFLAESDRVNAKQAQRVNDALVSIDHEVAEARRKELSHADPRYCNQWDIPPVKSEYERKKQNAPSVAGEHGTITFRSQCGYPTTWEVHAFGVRDYACDVHLSQAVRGLSELEKISVIDVVVREH